MLLTHARALSASQFVHKKTFQRIHTSTHSAGLELTKLTYTRLEDNLIRHRGDRLLYNVPVIPDKLLYNVPGTSDKLLTSRDDAVADIDTIAIPSHTTRSFKLSRKPAYVGCGPSRTYLRLKPHCPILLEYSSGSSTVPIACYSA